MATKEGTPAAIILAEDKYRWFNPQEEESTVWRLGGPPTYDVVNKLFEEDRTKVDESLKVEDVEIYYDPSELFGGLLQGPVVPGAQSESNTSSSVTPPQGCPFAM